QFVAVAVARQRVHAVRHAPEAQLDVGVGQNGWRVPRRGVRVGDLVEVEGARAQRPFPVDPAGRRVAVVHVRRGAEEPFLAQLALVGAAGQGGVRLARGTAFDARERDVVFQAVFSSGLPDDLRCSMIVSNETIVKEWFQVKRPVDRSRGAFDLESFLPYRLSVTTNRVSRAFAAQYEQEFG